MKQIRTYLCLALVSLFGSCSIAQESSPSNEIIATNEQTAGEESFAMRLSKAAVSLTNDQVIYDPSYFNIEYPGGDIPSGLGVCTDVVIRAYRKLDIDLQQLVHEDMKAHFQRYPQNWGLEKTDTNIDHRRVPNLMVFFERFGEKLEISSSREDYVPGDIVCWKLSGGATHIGLLSNERSIVSNRFYIIHNIGGGQVKQDCLFDYEIIGHYRYAPTP